MRKKVKRWILVLLVIIVLWGFTTADRGVDPVPETQGFTALTVIDASGNVGSDSAVQWRITDDLNGLGGIPPLGYSGTEGSIDVISWEPFQATAQGQIDGAALYTVTYSEKTMSNGVGQIGYSKSLELDTQAMLTGQSNIEATKLIQYIGENGGSVSSDDFISVSGTANPSPYASFGLGINTDAPEPVTKGNSKSSCIFAGGDGSGILPAFCTYAESTSSIDMSVANVRTTSDARFVVSSADTPVILDHNIRATNSVGKASASMDALIMESNPSADRIDFAFSIYPNPEEEQRYDITGWVSQSSTVMMESLDASEYTSIDGTIRLFDKAMRYDSGASR
jgi:hypothetical protein